MKTINAILSTDPAYPMVKAMRDKYEATIAELKDNLSKFQLSEFNPDWSMLQASQESLREHMQMIKSANETIAAQAKCIDELTAWLDFIASPNDPNRADLLKSISRRDK